MRSIWVTSSLMLLLCASAARPLHAARVDFLVQNDAEEPLSNALVIVKSVRGVSGIVSAAFPDVVRMLTDDVGHAAAVDLRPGLYRVIAAFPFGLWQTTVREFTVEDDPVSVALTMGIRMLEPGIQIPPPAVATVAVSRTDGSPVVGALVIARAATSDTAVERQATSDTFGEARLELSGDVVVVVSGSTVIEHRVTPEEIGSIAASPRILIRLP